LTAGLKTRLYNYNRIIAVTARDRANLS